MAASQGTIRVQRGTDQVDVRVIGWGNMHHGLPLRRFAEQCLKQGASCFRVDLRQCTYLDSTFLGTLLHVKRLLGRRMGRLVLLSPSPECLRLFQQMGIEHVFTTETEGECCDGTWEELAGVCDDPQGFNRTVVEAHQELAKLDGPAGEKFGPVARCLTRDWNAQQPDSGGQP
jgi:anti-sigma B factor antagonist